MIKAYVLHRRSYKETSLLLELLTEEYGRIAVIAKGAKKNKSPWRGLLEPFAALLLQLGGAYDLKTLHYAELLHYEPAFYGDPLLAGLYANELLVRLLERDLPAAKLFADYEKLLQQLRAGKALDTCLRYFECHLLQFLGYALDFSTESITQVAVQEQAYYQFLAEQGIVRVDYPGKQERKTLISGQTLLALQEQQLTTAEQRRQAKQFLRTILQHYLGGKPLNSRLLWYSMKKTHMSG